MDWIVSNIQSYLDVMIGEMLLGIGIIGVLIIILLVWYIVERVIEWKNSW